MHLRNHNEKLLAQVKKYKTKKHKLEQEKERFDKKFNESLSEKEEENLCLKDLNKKLLEQIKCLKNEMLECQNKVDLRNEECLHLKNHNQNMLKQIKNIKDDKESL